MIIDCVKFFIQNGKLIVNGAVSFLGENMAYIGDLSALITCLLFLFYIVGHTWTLFKESSFGTACVKIDYDRTMEEIDDFDLIADEDAGEVVLLVTNADIKQISLYNVKAVTTPIFKRFHLKIDGNRVACKKMIPAGEIIKIRCMVPEGIPRNKIVINRNDGIKEMFLLGYDGRMEGNGVAPTEYKIKRTLSAWLYYMLR